MKDIIDERNKREKMQKSIIKYWNVKYSPAAQGEACAAAAVESPENEQERQKRELAEQLLKRQEEKKRLVVEEAIEEDAIERGKIDKILHEKTERIQNIVDNKGIMS